MVKSSAITAYALLLPALVALAIFRIYPIAVTIWGSLCTESFEKAGTSVFSGISNYVDLFTDPVFWGSLWVTIKLNLVINPLQIALALGLALMANQRFEAYKSGFVYGERGRALAIVVVLLLLVVAVVALQFRLLRRSGG